MNAEEGNVAHERKAQRKRWKTESRCTKAGDIVLPLSVVWSFNVTSKHAPAIKLWGRGLMCKNGPVMHFVAWPYKTNILFGEETS